MTMDIPAFYSDWFVERFNGGNGYSWPHLKYGSSAKSFS